MLPDRSQINRAPFWTLVVALLFTSTSSLRANYIWQHRVQVTHADESIIVDDIAAARYTTGTEKFHFTIQNPGYGFADSFGYLFTYPENTNPNMWATLWGTEEAFFEPGHRTVDQHIAVDKTGDVHVLYEAHDYFPPVPLGIGYKMDLLRIRGHSV
jgi:hypothetical protein